MASPELWHLIPSAPGILASSRGRVMVLPKLGPMPRGGTRSYGARARRGSWDGNRYVIWIAGKNYKVARLICEAFHGPPPFPEAVCMHKDENSRNNLPDNLAWGTQKENLNAPGFIAYCKSRIGENSPTAKARAKAA